MVFTSIFTYLYITYVFIICNRNHFLNKCEFLNWYKTSHIGPTSSDRNKEAMTSLIITAGRIVKITNSRPQVNAAVSGSNPEIARLVQAIENLVSRMNQLEAQPRRRRSRSQPGRSNPRRHCSSTRAEEGFCFYHSTYVDKARKCESPCSRRQPPKN
ncbi:unnamed protein product [Nesidiocoris tenuis]|uniref:Uncharacterized protein n=1 Tax=Nesidiocoris tenuis TaxID=355587 RepID=A0A6H5GCW6_9HEMI|nr:unnamed protein product [Nesidiocoris tenuis]